MKEKQQINGKSWVHNSPDLPKELTCKKSGIIETCLASFLFCFQSTYGW